MKERDIEDGEGASQPLSSIYVCMYECVYVCVHIYICKLILKMVNRVNFYNREDVYVLSGHQ